MKSFGSPPPAVRPRATGTKTVVGSNDRNSDVLTQRVRFDPTSTRSTLAPVSGPEGSIGSARDRGSKGEGIGEDDDEKLGIHTTSGGTLTPKSLGEDVQIVVIPETPQDDSEEELQDDDDFGGSDAARVDDDPTGPIPRLSQGPAPTNTPCDSGTVLGKRDRSLDLAEYYHGRLKSSYKDEEFEVRRARTLGVETPGGREALQRAVWKRDEMRDLRRELRYWVAPPPRPLDPNVEAVSKAFDEFSFTMRETFSHLRQ